MFIGVLRCTNFSVFVNWNSQYFYKILSIFSVQEWKSRWEVWLKAPFWLLVLQRHKDWVNTLSSSVMNDLITYNIHTMHPNVPNTESYYDAVREINSLSGMNLTSDPSWFTHSPGKASTKRYSPQIFKGSLLFSLSTANKMKQILCVICFDIKWLSVLFKTVIIQSDDHNVPHYAYKTTAHV